MKNNKRLTRIAVKTGTPDGDLFKTLFAEVFKGEKIPIEPGLTVYRMEDGTLMECYGPGSSYPDYFFKQANIILGFKVGNLDETILLLQNGGARLMGKIETVCNDFIYCHLLLSNKTVIALYQDVDSGNKKTPL